MAGGITQAEYWNGEVGARWARNQAVLDALFTPLTEALLARVPVGDGASALDIGCGSGATTLEVARRIGPGGRVTGADISAPLLAVARDRAASEAPGGAPIHFIEADVETADLGRFDQILSRFGVMFFSDSARAFANVRRMLAPGGRLTVLCWRALPENLWVSVPREAVLPFLPALPPPQPDTPGPFRFAEADVLVALLRGAGFETVTCDAVDRDIVLGRGESDAAAVETATRISLDLGPNSHLVREAAPDLRARAEAGVTDVLRQHAREGSVQLRAACWLVQAG